MVFRCSMKRAACLIVLVFGFASFRANAQSVGAACSTAGTLSLIGSSSPGELLVCNGTIWGLAEAIASGGNIGIGTTMPGVSLDISQRTDAIALPVGTTGQRPTASNGMIRYNSTTPDLEAYINGAWQVLTTGGSGTTITLGTSASVTNPQRSGDATTGF